MEEISDRCLPGSKLYMPTFISVVRCYLSRLCSQFNIIPDSSFTWPARKPCRIDLCSHLRTVISARFLKRRCAALVDRSSSQCEQFLVLIGSKWEVARTGAQSLWNKSKYSEVDEDWDLVTKPCRSTETIRRSTCVNNLFHLCAVPVHGIPDSFSCRRKKLSPI